MRISELAKRCGYEYCGEDRWIHSIRSAEAADRDSIAIITDVKQLDETAADCVLMPPVFAMTGKSIVYVSNPIELAAIRVAEALMASGDIPAPHKTVYHREGDYFRGKNVVIGQGTVVCPGACIEDGVRIGKDCFIEPNAHIGGGTVIHDGVYIGCGSSIGADSFYHYRDTEGYREFRGVGRTILHSRVSVGDHTSIQRGTFGDTVVGEGSKLGSLINIGHDVVIGRNCRIVSQTGIASEARIGDEVQIYGKAGIANRVSIGSHAVVHAAAMVSKDVAQGQSVSGFYAREHVQALRTQAKLLKL